MSGDGSVYWNAFQCSISKGLLTLVLGFIPRCTKKSRERRQRDSLKQNPQGQKVTNREKEQPYQDLSSPRPTFLLRDKCPTPPLWLWPKECRSLLAPHPRTFCAQILCLCLTPRRSMWNDTKSLLQWRNAVIIATLQERSKSSACWESMYLHRLLIDFVRPPAKFV